MDTLNSERPLSPAVGFDDLVLPPDYDEVVSSTRYPILQTPEVSESSGQRQFDSNDNSHTPKWKLKFVDFTPHLTGNTLRRTPGSFEKLIDRANTWLQSNKHVDVITCETVSWCADDMRRLNETDVITTKIKKGNVKKMHFMRGLRIWLIPRRRFNDECVILGVREYIPEILDVKGLENFDIKLLLRQANNNIQENPIPGHIININTTLQPSRADTSKEKYSLRIQDTYWTDGVKIHRKYIPIIRIFYVKGPTSNNVEIGITDMLPRIIRQAGRQKYEDLESLMTQASQWIQNQPHINVTNLQTVTYRRRGFIQGVGMPVFWSSPDSEETCIRFIRIAYTKPMTVVTLHVLRSQPHSVRKRTFAPRRCLTSGGSGSSQHRRPDDAKYHTFTKTVDEVSDWLRRAGVELLSVETLRQQVHEGCCSGSPDSSLVKASDEKTRDFITLVRIFLKTRACPSFIASRPAQNSNSDPTSRSVWERANQDASVRHVTKRRWTHVIIIVVILTAMLVSAAVIVFVLAIGREWL